MNLSFHKPVKPQYIPASIGNANAIVERPVGILIIDLATSETALLHADCQYQHPMLAHGSEVRIDDPPGLPDGVTAYCAVCRQPLKMERIE